jgi:hypothetical protein
MLNLEHKNMKTKIERQGSTEIPRFAVGALAIAGASAASGATVQIKFANNSVSSSDGLTYFLADLTGDTLDDLFGVAGLAYGGPGGGPFAAVAAIGSSFALAMARANPEPGSGALLGLLGDGWFGTVARTQPFDWVPLAAGVDGFIRGLTVPYMRFNDSDINGGATTFGRLDLTVSHYGGEFKVQVHRLIFDDQSTTAPTVLPSDLDDIPVWTRSSVPEPSSLALLALGAGGLLARRRRAQAAA